MTDAKNDDVSFVHVGNVMLAKRGDEFTGVELVFTKNVMNRVGATSVLDTLRNAMNASAWTTNTIMRVEDGHAQINTQANNGSDTDAETPRAKRKGRQADTDAETT